MTHLALYGTARTPEAARITQQSYKEDLSFKCTLSTNMNISLHLRFISLFQYYAIDLHPALPHVLPVSLLLQIKYFK